MTNRSVRSLCTSYRQKYKSHKRESHKYKSYLSIKVKSHSVSIATIATLHVARFRQELILDSRIFLCSRHISLSILVVTRSSFSKNILRIKNYVTRFVADKGDRHGRRIVMPWLVGDACIVALLSDSLELRLGTCHCPN